jgi:hypothetical protein
MWRPPARQGGGERKGSIDDYGKGNNDRDELERGGGNTAGGKEGTLLKRKGWRGKKQKKRDVKQVYAKIMEEAKIDEVAVSNEDNTAPSLTPM